MLEIKLKINNYYRYLDIKNNEDNNDEDEDNDDDDEYKEKCGN